MNIVKELRKKANIQQKELAIAIGVSRLWMGHADEKLILRIYDHVGENRTKKSIEQVENMLLGVKSDKQKK